MPSRVNAERAQIAHRYLWALFIFLAVLMLLALCFFYVFLLREVEFIGAERFGEDELLQMTGAAYHESLFLIDPEEVAENLSANPFVEVIAVEKEYPWKLRITVAERDGCALTGEMEHTLLLDAAGNVLHTDADVLEKELCRVTGWSVVSSRAGEKLEVDDPETLACYAAVMQELERFGISGGVETVQVEDPLDIVLTMRDGMTVKIGSKDNMTMKITWLAQMLQELPAQGYRGGILDVSSGRSAGYIPPGEEKTEEGLQ